MSPKFIRKILIVDDDVRILAELRRILGSDFDVTTAESAAEGKEILTDHGPFAVVISDLKTDEPGDSSFLKAVKSNYPETVCVMLTDYANMDTAVASVNQGVVFRFLTKPCSAQTLIDTVNEALQHYRHMAGMTSYTYSCEIKDGIEIKCIRSSGCYAVTGYTNEEFDKDPQLKLDILIPEFRGKVENNYSQVLDGFLASPIIYQIKTKDELVRWLKETTIPHKDENNKVVRLDGFVEDITIYKEMSERLQQSQAQYKRITANLPGVVFQVELNTDGKCELKYISNSCRDFLNVDPSQIDSFDKFVNIFGESDGDRMVKAFHNSAKSHEPCIFNAGVEVNSRQRWFQLVGRPERFDNNRCVWDGLILDVTVTRRTEIELQKANSELKESNRLKSEFISTVSHEMRTPLFIFKNVISNALAGMFGRMNKKLRKNLEMADTSIDRLARIISDFLDCSKIEAGALVLERENLCVQDVIKDTIKSIVPLGRENKVIINTNMPKTELMINADRDRFVQILTNLLSNAVKFTAYDTDVNVFVTDHINEVEIAIQDKGPGISKKDMEKIFNRFIQLRIIDKRKPGTGIGLNIAKELIELHGGRIWVDSAVGEGSCFSFVMPKSIVENIEEDTEIKVEGK